MSCRQTSRRQFLQMAAASAGASLLPPFLADRPAPSALNRPQPELLPAQPPADYTLHIRTVPLEIASGVIVSATAYNDQFPGPLLRFQQGRQAVVEVHNHTDTPELLHWHGQFVPPSVDGASEEGSPFILPHGSRRIIFTPQPAGFRFYHTHVRAGANLHAGMYSALAGPVYIEPRNNPGSYDREIFLTLKEFEPSFSRGGDMAMDFLEPSARVPALESRGESAMKASLAKGMPHGYEVGFRYFTINGHMLGQGEPLRIKRGERVLFHVLNASATEIRSLALPGHSFRVVALDGNPVPRPAEVPVLWLGTAERVSAIVEMNQPGVWVLGDLDDDDRSSGMGIVLEYAGSTGKPRWMAPQPFRWSYARFAAPPPAHPAPPDEHIEMLIEKRNASSNGFNQWTINGAAFDMQTPRPSLHLREGRRFRIFLRNASDDIHPVHLHRHTFELASFAGVHSAGLRKDVLMLGGYQEAEIDFLADNPGLTLFHCHQQLHMDYGFMALFDYE